MAGQARVLRVVTGCGSPAIIAARACPAPARPYWRRPLSKVRRMGHRQLAGQRIGGLVHALPLSRSERRRSRQEATAADHADHRGRILVTRWPGSLGSTLHGVAGMVSLESPASIANGGAMAETRKLYRSKTNRVLAGVCGGLAEYFGLDATLIRVLFVLLAVLGGAGLVLYVAMWIIVPNQP